MTGRRGFALTFGLPLVAYVALYFIDATAFHPSGDGYYSWVFARSLAFDGDIELTIDYAQCGDPFDVGRDRGPGHPDNPFYVGPALFWVPPPSCFSADFSLSSWERPGQSRPRAEAGYLH